MLLKMMLSYLQHLRSPMLDTSNGTNWRRSGKIDFDSTTISLNSFFSPHLVDRYISDTSCTQNVSFTESFQKKNKWKNMNKFKCSINYKIYFNQPLFTTYSTLATKSSAREARRSKKTPLLSPDKSGSFQPARKIQKRSAQALQFNSCKESE